MDIDGQLLIGKTSQCRKITRFQDRPHFKPFSSSKMAHDATVSILIDNENKWKTDMIQQMFQKEDADAILSIQLPKRQRKNEVMI